MYYVYDQKNQVVVKATKKGRSSSGQQIWKRSTDHGGGTFRTELGAEQMVDQTNGRILGTGPTTTSSISKAPQSNSKPSSKKTRILVNNNQVKQVNGDLEVQDAVELVGAYFREVTRENASVYEDSGGKKIEFKIRTGSKS